jgi:transposase
MKFAERKKRVSIIGALNKNELKAPFVFEGNGNREIFSIDLEKCLLPELKPGQIVIVDNASFHKGGRISQIIHSASCEVLYLPPYSPDLNPIEHHWFALKHYIKLALKQFQRNLYSAVQYVFDTFLT